MNRKKYQTKSHRYVNPQAYDERKKQPLERYLDSLWKPIIAATGAQYIRAEDTVCDFGCGTLAHASFMQSAQKIYAIDTNRSMVDFGLAKLPIYLQEKITPIITNATSTGISQNTCSVIWSIGLTEYVSLPDLFKEMTRVSKKDATIILQFPNRYHPMHIAIFLANIFRNKKNKRYRTLSEIRSFAEQQGWSVERTIQTGFYTPVPGSLIPYCAPIWKYFNWIGNNTLAVLRRSNPEQQK